MVDGLSGVLGGELIVYEIGNEDSLAFLLYLTLENEI